MCTVAIGERLYKLVQLCLLHCLYHLFLACSWSCKHQVFANSGVEEMCILFNHTDQFVEVVLAYNRAGHAHLVRCDLPDNQRSARVSVSVWICPIRWDRQAEDIDPA